MGEVQNIAVIVVKAPHKNTIKRLYGNGGARDPRHFLEEVDTAWQIQPRETDLEMAELQQTLGDSRTAIQSLTEEVARLTSLVARGAGVEPGPQCSSGQRIQAAHHHRLQMQGQRDIARQYLKKQQGKRQATADVNPAAVPERRVSFRKKTCFQCGLNGHLARSCPTTKKETSACIKTSAKTQQQVAEQKAVRSRRVLEEKKAIVSRVTETVKWFNVKRGYDSINREHTKEDVLFHHTAKDLTKNNIKKYRRRWRESGVFGCG